MEVTEPEMTAVRVVEPSLVQRSGTGEDQELGELGVDIELGEEEIVLGLEEGAGASQVRDIDIAPEE